jgi:hypothetical protein
MSMLTGGKAAAWTALARRPKRAPMRTLLACLLLVSLAAPALAAPSAKAVMAAWDDNQDGVITRAEWLAAGRSDKTFRYTDTNHDGKVTLAELKIAIAKAKKAGKLLE